ncbi:MAG: hypothetical protein WDN06_10085 [Asticcacaulis sp.]
MPRPRRPLRPGRLVRLGRLGPKRLGRPGRTLSRRRNANNASYQTVTLASGKSMVRLKVGPVAGDSQAEALCGQLGVHDAWCSKG